MTKVVTLKRNCKQFPKILLLLFVGALPMWSQNSAVITGKVIDKQTDESLIGATVSVQGEQSGASTDLDGAFSLSVSSLPATLKISYVGYKPQEIDVYEAGQPIVVQLEDASRLNEIVVVGYREQKRGELTSAVSSLSGSVLADAPTVNLTEKLQGEIPGLTISSNSGVPGTSSLVRLRGATSISANNDPIYIIDGVFVSTEKLQKVALGGQLVDPLADINPEDIESISVLKDASATAAYGARGANGVIIITTKRGEKNQKTKINFKAETGISYNDKLWDLASGPEHAQLINDTWVNDGNSFDTRPFRPKTEIFPSGAKDPLTGNTVAAPLGAPEEQPTYDRLHDIFRTAKQQTYNLSATGGNEKTNFFLGGAYTRQQATLKLQDFERYNFRVNLDHRINNQWTIGTSNVLSLTNRQLVQVGDGPDGYFQAALHTPVFYPVYKEDGSYNKPVTFDNHQAILDNYDGHAKGIRSINNVYAKWHILEGLVFKSSWSNDFNIYHEKFYYNTYLTKGANNGRAIDSYTTSNIFTTEQLLNYNKTLDKHFISGFLGTSYLKRVWENEWLQGEQFPTNDFKRISSAAVKDATSDGSSSALLSFFGGASYSYDNRYNLDFTLRADGSSRVGANNRWGYFPAVGGAWNVSRESFFPANQYLSNLRVKASIGLTGNENIGDFASRGLWSGGKNYAGSAGISPDQLANPDLKWETTRQWNAGLNFSLLKERIDVEFNYYNKYTYDLLLKEPVPGKTGFHTIAKNSGELSNKGIEIAINTLNIKKRYFTWTTDFTFTHNKNVVEKLPVPISGGTGGSTAYLLQEGYPLYSLWVWDYRGVDPLTGKAIYADHDGVPGITVDDKVVVGDIWPDFEGLVRNTFTYKNWSLNFAFYYKYGNDMFNYTRLFLESGGTRGTGRSVLADAIDYWRQPGDTGVLPAPKTTFGSGEIGNYETQTSRVVEDASFIRLRNVTLTYALPKRLVQKAGLSKASVHVTGNNLLLFTNYSGPDPEMALDKGENELVQGMDFGTPPQPKTILIGVNLTF